MGRTASFFGSPKTRTVFPAGWEATGWGRVPGPGPAAHPWSSQEPKALQSEAQLEGAGPAYGRGPDPVGLRLSACRLTKRCRARGRSPVSGACRSCRASDPPPPFPGQGSHLPKRGRLRGAGPEACPHCQAPPPGALSPRRSRAAHRLPKRGGSRRAGLGAGLGPRGVSAWPGTAP